MNLPIEQTQQYLNFATMKTIDDFNFKDKRVLIRVDFNVPLDKETLEINDDTRLKAAIPTINKIINDGGKVILMSHLGRPKNGPEENFSLKHIVTKLSELLNRDVKFCNNCIGEQVHELINKMNSGEVILLENLRFYKEEEQGDISFAKSIASLGDFYVNDAFGTAHRRHASTAVIADYFSGNKCVGYLMANEINNADRVMKNAKHPFTAIMGGAKVSDKILIIDQLLNKVDHLIIGGGMAFTFFKAMGGEIGSSICENDKLELAISLIEKAKNKNVQIHLPSDSLVADAFNNNANTQVVDSGKIPEGWMGLDIGPVSIKKFSNVIENSKTILWNGPMGVFEMSAFSNGTREVAGAIVKATTNGSFSLIGGGDSAAAINKFGWSEKVSYVSTGGGALLEYIEGKSLPGVEMLLQD